MIFKDKKARAIAGKTKKELVEIQRKIDSGEIGGGGAVIDVVFYTEPTYYTTVGREFNIYWDNISTCINPSDILFAVSTTSGTLVFTAFDDCLRVTSDVNMVGTHTVTVSAKNRYTDGVIKSTTFNLVVVANDTLNKSVKGIFIGDSLTHASGDVTIAKIPKDLAGSNFTLYGTMGTSPYLYEGRVSWSAGHYLASSNYNTYNNPFYNAAKSGPSKFDFAYYITNNPSFSDVNLVNIFLGRNVGYDVTEVDRIKTMVDSIKAYNPDIVVTLVMAYHYGYSYPNRTNLYNTKTLREYTFNFNTALKAAFAGYNKVFCLPLFVNVDNFYDHPHGTVGRSARNTGDTIVKASDQIHFSTSGYPKLGDMYYGYFKWLQQYITDVIVSCTGIALNQSSLTFTNSNTQTLTTTIVPANTTQSVTWTSSNTSIATVSNGVVTPIANGSAIITATCGAQVATCSVSVSGLSASIPATGVSLSSSTLSFTSSDTQTITATKAPANSTDSVTWSTSNSAVATVANGVVTPVANGTCTITASCGSYQTTCSITVNIPASGFTMPTYTLAYYPYYVIDKQPSDGKLIATMSSSPFTSRNWNSSSNCWGYLDASGNFHLTQKVSTDGGATWSDVTSNWYASNALVYLSAETTVFKANYAIGGYTP